MLTLGLYARLSGFYLFYFAALGVLLPYWGLYLQALGFDPARIGELTAIPQATKLVAPNLWGWLADRSGWRMRMVRWACLATALSFAGVYAAGNSYLGLALVGLLFSFFWNAALPQFEAVTLNHLGQHTHHYSQVRLWGSVGFVVAAVGVGFLVRDWGISLVPALMLGLFIAIWLNSLLVPDRPAAPLTQAAPPLAQVLRQPAVIAFFTACFLNQAAHGAYYGFFSLYLEGYGYSREFIGLLWGLGVTVEVGMFLLMHRLLPRFGPRRLMLAALALATLRWWLIGHFAGELPILLFAQTLHAFSFGVFHAVSMHLIHQFFPGSLQGRGQALYSSLSFGAGNAVGSLAAGYLWQGLGAVAMFDLATALGALGWWVAWRGLRV
ncbi:MFS transporter [Candidatus Contendibacter odensensis]|uniref:Peptidase M23 n=1 Tax=Candidatus Contendobacter odensis Run_B_J11 TaxID=1400861 RepID=A0A7U7J464_9GAMM|nr:MFS transporter [Candidatus Contendobacter odensis]CDH44927.1 Peptidase M23 [Candidatus Contendobacter odensis Run_B_J11]